MQVIMSTINIKTKIKATFADFSSEIVGSQILDIIFKNWVFKDSMENQKYIVISFFISNELLKLLK